MKSSLKQSQPRAASGHYLVERVAGESTNPVSQDGTEGGSARPDDGFGPPFHPFIAAVAALLIAGGDSGATAQGPNPCAGQAACSEVGTFVATVTDFRTSKVSYYTIVSATVRFKNKTSRPLILGYVGGSGTATDDQGHRYEVTSANGVRGIGWITGNTFDSKFTLQPGEAADARIEMAWRPASRGDIFGTSWVMEFAIREIDPLAGNQFRLGREHALSFRGFKEGWLSTTETVAASSAPAAVPASAPGEIPEAAAESGAGYDILIKQSDPAVGFLRAARIDLTIAYTQLRQPDKSAKFFAEITDSAGKALALTRP